MQGAARRALEQAGLDARDLGALVMVESRVQETFLSSEVTLLQQRLGAENALTFSVGGLGCVSITPALLTARGLLAADPALDDVLVVHGSKPATALRYRHPVTVNGDGGQALLLSRSGGARRSGRAAHPPRRGYGHPDRHGGLRPRRRGAGRPRRLLREHARPAHRHLGGTDLGPIWPPSPTRTCPSTWSPLFQVMPVLTPSLPERLELPGVSATVDVAGRGSAGFDLTFGLFERRDADGTCRGLDGVVEYRTDLFDRSTVASLCARYARLLHTAAATPDDPVHAIDLSGAEER
ncbi:hypothetical protein [Streptomyces sp. Go40/10]|uniref:hypothetical protein n=1 Tax=Streptomyces sp. Go40/10 TaxID=2825844 RepID=UPI003FA7B582